MLLADRILVLKDGKFIVDLDVTEPRESRRTWAGLLQIRLQLLEELGVVH
ncbi:hypothetical protein [Aeromicrobium sp. UC242_57]